MTLARWTGDGIEGGAGVTETITKCKFNILHLYKWK